jgi:transposase
MEPPRVGRDGTADMHLSDHDLQQLDDDYLHGLPVEPLRLLSGKLLADLKEAHDRLNQNPSNSSRPPSTRAPWEKADSGSDEACAPQATEAEAPTDQPEEDAAAAQDVEPDSTPIESDVKPQGETKPGRPGRRKGAPGVSRTQVLPVDAEEIHRPEICAACGARLGEELECRPYTGHLVVDVVPPLAARAWCCGRPSTPIWRPAVTAVIAPVLSLDVPAPRSAGRSISASGTWPDRRWSR